MSSSSEPKHFHGSAQAWHPFPRLPLELRNQIWHAAAQQRRNLDIWRIPIGTLCFHPLTPRTASNYIQTYRFCTTRPVPAVLHVNRESRAIALQYYVLAFGCVNHVDCDHEITIKAPPRTYVNWKLDTLLLLGERDDNAIADALADALRPEGVSIAIEISKLQFDEDWSELTFIAASGGAVKEVVFYTDALNDGVQLDIKQLRRQGAMVELVDLEEGEEQRPELILIEGREQLEIQFQLLEENVDGAYRFDDITWEEAQERRKVLERRPVVRFAKLLIRDTSKPSWRTAFIGPRGSAADNQLHG